MLENCLCLELMALFKISSTLFFNALLTKQSKVKGSDLLKGLPFDDDLGQVEDWEQLLPRPVQRCQQEGDIGRIGIAYRV